MTVYPPEAAFVIRRVDNHDETINTATSVEHGEFLRDRYIRMRALQGDTVSPDEYEIVPIPGREPAS